MYKILIIEDDLPMAQAIQKEMKMWGNEAQYVQDFQNVLTEFTEYDPHLVLMDITLPFYNGYHWCSEIRKISNVPVIFISSASDNMNIIMAVNMGGDDFVAKPFDLSVLMAKVQAVLRRTYDLAGKIPVLEHRGAIPNLYDTTLTYNGEKISLTKNEFRILQTLMEHKGKIVSRDTLMTRLWETDCYVDENTLTVNVNRLRKKLDAAGLSKEYLPTWVPEGYEVELIEAYDTGTIKDIYLLLQGKEGSSIDFFISIHQTPESMESTIFEKDEAPVRTVQMDGRDIYFFENLDSQRAVSQYQNIIYALSGDISEQIVLGILSSIGG